MAEVQGKVTIAPNVLLTIVRQTTLDQPGVRRLAPLGAKMRNLPLTSGVGDGMVVAVTESGVQVEVHVVADADANLLQLGHVLQSQISQALEMMVGMPAAQVDIFIDSVALPETKKAS